MAHHLILLRLNAFDLRVDTEGWWFEHSVIVVIVTGRFVYMAHHFIFLWLNPFNLRVDREGCVFEHSVS